MAAWRRAMCSMRVTRGSHHSTHAPACASGPESILLTLGSRHHRHRPTSPVSLSRLATSRHRRLLPPCLVESNRRLMLEPAVTLARCRAVAHQAGGGEGRGSATHTHLSECLQPLKLQHITVVHACSAAVRGVQAASPTSSSRYSRKVAASWRRALVTDSNFSLGSSERCSLP